MLAILRGLFGRGETGHRMRVHHREGRTRYLECRCGCGARRVVYDPAGAPVDIAWLTRARAGNEGR